jgi:hypothetical protein
MSAGGTNQNSYYNQGSGPQISHGGSGNQNIYTNLQNRPFAEVTIFQETEDPGQQIMYAKKRVETSVKAVIVNLSNRREKKEIIIFSGHLYYYEHGSGDHTYTSYDPVMDDNDLVAQKMYELLEKYRSIGLYFNAESENNFLDIKLQTGRVWAVNLFSDKLYHSSTSSIDLNAFNAISIDPIVSYRQEIKTRDSSNMVVFTCLWYIVVCPLLVKWDMSHGGNIVESVVKVYLLSWVVAFVVGIARKS